MSLIRGVGVFAAVEVEVSDPQYLGSLQSHLREQPGVEVVRIARRTAAGEQGAWDVLQVAAASGGALAVAFGVIPAFLESRSRKVSVIVRKGEGADREEIEITAANADDAMRLLKRMLDG